MPPKVTMQDRAMDAANGLEKQSCDGETHAMECNFLSLGSFLASLGAPCREGVLHVLLDEVLIQKKGFHLVIGAVLK